MEILVRSLDEVYEDKLEKAERKRSPESKKSLEQGDLDKSKGPWKRGKKPSTPEEHRTKIARDTLKMPDAMVGVMGGMNKEEAKEFMDKHHARKSIMSLDEAYEELEKSKGQSKPEEETKRSRSPESKKSSEQEDLGKGKVYDPAAVAASIGRKKYGATKMSEMAAAGRRRKKAPKGKAKQRLGGGGRFAKLEREIGSKNK